MFLDVKNSNKRGKKGQYALTQNLVIIIIILILVGMASFIIYKAVSGKLAVHP